MKPQILVTSSFLALVTLSLAFALAPRAQAADDYFYGNVSSTDPMNSNFKWNFARNGSGIWNHGPSSSDVAQFGDWHGFFPSDGGATYSWAGIRFYTDDWTMNTASGGLIALNGVSNDWIIQCDFTGGGSNVINSPLALNATNSFIDMVDSGATLTLNGAIQNGTGTGLGVRGNGTVVLNGVNNYTGGTTVNGGTLSLTSNNGNCPIKDILTVNAGATVVTTGDSTGLGYNGGQSVTSLNINGGTVTAAGGIHIWSTMTDGVNMTGGILQSNGGTTTTDGPQLEWGAAAVNTFASSQTATIAGRIRIRQEVAPNVTFTVADGAAVTDLLITASITDNNNANISKAGLGTMTLSGANTYTGTTTVSGGTLALTSEGAVAATNGVYINNGGTVLLKNYNTIGGYITPRSVTIASGGLMTMDWDYSVNLGALTLNGGNLSSGGFSNSTYGSYKLQGDVTVGAGTSTISAVNVVSGGVRTFNVESGATLNVTGTFSNIDGNMGVTKAGGGTMVLSGANAYTGETTVTGGSLAVTGSSIADTNRLIIDGGTVNLTGMERVNTLFFGGNQQVPGTYSATGAGGTIASANFTGTGTLVVGISNFALWASTPAFGLIPSLQGATADPENDGITNLVEYALNGNPSASDPSIQPSLVVTATDFEFTYSRLDLSLADTVQTFEYGSDLTNWTPVRIPDGPAEDIAVGRTRVTIADTGTTDTVKISIPKSISVEGKLFGRLQVFTNLQTLDYGPSTTYTNAGKAYMGWHSTFVQQFSHGGIQSNISEQFLKNQTDWMAANFKSYGYNYICLDGWGAGSRFNSDGYISTQSDAWAGGWTEMASYIHSKGMKFGMYFNPAWIPKGIANNLNNKIKGTNYTIKSVTREDKLSGDVYIVDTTKPGAQQYVKGYIDYIISCGVDLLKADFMREYEQAYGHEQMVTLIRWMREAAGDDLVITLCLSIGKNHFQDERKYGDNIRVVGDYDNYLWYHTSDDSRGTVREFSWPVASNVFDGLCWTSDITGKGKFFASPDYVSFQNNGTDAQKKFAASIRFISGAPVEFGDSYSDIGSDTNANYLRNTELTDLNAEGFFGKPLTRNLSDPRSQIWAGTTANGDRVVALFNRDGYNQTRSVNFQNDLGLSGEHNIRDLWTHNKVGYDSSYSVTVPANGVVVIRIYVYNIPPEDGDSNPPLPLIGVKPTNGTYVISNKNSGKLLNVPGNSTANGTQLIQFPRGYGDNEKWRILDLGGDYYSITNVNSDKCVSVSGASQSNGAGVVQWDFSNALNDRWRIIDSGGGYYRFINQNSGKCMTIQNGVTTDGGSVVQQSYTGGNSDLWQVHLIAEVGPANGNYTIKNRNSGKVLNALGNSTADGASLVQLTQSPTNHEKWTITNVGGNSYSIINVSSNKCVTVLGASYADGATVGQWYYYGGVHDKWQILDSGDGYYRFVNQNSGKCMTVQNAEISSGNSIIQMNYSGGNQDQWELVPNP